MSRICVKEFATKAEQVREPLGRTGIWLPCPEKLLDVHTTPRSKSFDGDGGSFELSHDKCEKATNGIQTTQQNNEDIHEVD